MTELFLAPNQHARPLRAWGPYQHTAPGSSVVPITVKNGSQSPPFNRGIFGRLFAGQRLDAMATSGWAAQLNLTVMVGAAGQLTDAHLSDPIGVAGTGVVPNVTCAVSGSDLVLTFANPNIAGTITGLFDLEYWWVGDASW